MTITSAKVTCKSWADIVKKSTEAPSDDIDACKAPEALNNHSETSSTLEQTVSVPDDAEAYVEEVPANDKVEEACNPLTPGLQPSSFTFPSTPPGVFTENLQASAPLRPGRRGSRTCFCHGVVLHMLSHYGWLQVFGTVDHPLASKHLGRIYVNGKDVAGGRTLKGGDRVSFYLYADDVGLGAEECQVEAEDEEEAPVSTKLRADASSFVPSSAFDAPTSDSSVSDMFVRMSRTLNSIPANGHVEMTGVFNLAFFDDLTDSEDEDTDKSNVDADRGESDQCSGDSGEDAGHLQKSKLLALAPWKQAGVHIATDGEKMKTPLQRSMSPGITSDSTNVGATSESENESKDLVQQQKVSVPGKVPFRPPPGLEDFGPTFVT